MSALIWASIALVIIVVLYFFMKKMTGEKKQGPDVSKQNSEK
jgi:uncharacterized membrane protein YjfL (UPF0719 family)